MAFLPRLGFVFLALALPAWAQSPIARAPATSLRLPASPPATTYSTARVFPTLSFTQPVALVCPPGDNRRLFVVEKPGRIYVIPDVTVANPTRMLFLDLTSRVTVSSDANDERGLLALAFHPDYATNGQFYVWYTITATTGGGSGLHDRLARFRVSTSNPNLADATSEQPLITQRDEADNHNGGQIVFGPDGYLYLSVGDEGGGNDQLQNSQRIDRDFFSGVLRIDVDRRPGSLTPNAHSAVHAGTYTIPPDNPYVGATSFNGAAVSASAVRTEFWAVGLRNPWRMSFDPTTGQLWCGDVGQGTREEVDVIVRGGNYGWNYREGLVAGPRSNPPVSASFINPVWDYPRSEGASITGGLLYRGNRLPGLFGQYLFTDFVSGRIWSLQPDGTNTVNAARVQLLATDGGISAFGLDPATSDILLADLTEGVIKRLVAATPTGTGGFPATLSATGAFSNLASLTPAAGVIGYEPIVSFWSDHAKKRRWFALPDLTSQFSFLGTNGWGLPTGAVWVKHFELETTRGNPATARRIETRFLVKTATGVYGITYRWNDAQTEATLVPDEGADAAFTINEGGVTRPQTWHFPSRAECLTCHTPAGGYALSFNTRQLNHDHTFSGGRGNIVDALSASGYLSVPQNVVDPGPVARVTLAAPDDLTKTLEHRARSYLDANCAQCHQPGGPALGSWDARLATPLAAAGIVNGALVDNGGDSANHVLVPGDVTHSRLLQRMILRGTGQMPPIGTNERDVAGESLVVQWITALGVPQPPSRIVNLAARGQLGTASSTLIAGFVIGPGANKQVLVRAVGPTLGNAPFLVPGSAPNPTLTLFGPNSSTLIAATNDNWGTGGNAANLRSAAASVGAFALAENSGDAALLATLAPGSYTAQANGANATAGIALVEIYDADPLATPNRSRLINTAVRAQVGVGANVLIPGVVVADGGSKTLLIRAIGPGLAAFGVTDALSQPVLTLFTGAQPLLTNTGWNNATNAADIRTTARNVGAFALTEGSRDSAILVTLSPGPYTIQVSGTSDSSGVALVEVYEVP